MVLDVGVVVFFWVFCVEFIRLCYVLRFVVVFDKV